MTRRLRVETGNTPPVAGIRTLFQIETGREPKEVHTMMNREQAIAYGKRTGVRYYIYNDKGCLVGGTQTYERAQAMKRDFEIEDRGNPWTHGTTRFEIREAK